jgi:hypothetical protein
VALFRRGSAFMVGPCEYAGARARAGCFEAHSRFGTVGFGSLRGHDAVVNGKFCIVLRTNGRLDASLVRFASGWDC